MSTNYHDMPGFNPDKEYHYIETAKEIWRGNDLSKLMEHWVRQRSKWPALSVGRIAEKLPQKVCNGKMCNHDSEYCEATVETDGFICTLAKGHTGPHCACCYGADAHNLHIWNS